MIKPDKSDKENYKKWKDYKLDLIREQHRQLIKDLGIETKDFNMKKVFSGKYNKEIVRIFQSEFKKEKGLFFELINSELDPVDPERKVYRLTPSESYQDEYYFNEAIDQYEVPVEELRLVDKASVAISKSSAVTSSDRFLKETFEKPTYNSKNNVTLEDAPYNDMTIRDYMAIHTGTPVSLKPWLNDLIKSSK